MHWNAGGRLWQNKILEVEALLHEKRPQICFISEANLWVDVPQEEVEIEGYKMHLPSTMSSQNHARIIVLVRNDLNVHIMRDHMDLDTAAIWLRIGSSKNALIIGGVYRQHQILGEAEKELTKSELVILQEKRWSKILKKWKAVSRGKNCILIGDTNLDHLRWSDPESHLVSMVEETKDIIENSGFSQLITGHTRSWRQQADSLLDQIWSNCPQRTVRTYNETRSSSDHNVVGIDIAMKDIKVGGVNVVKRLWKNFDKDKFQQSLRVIDWNVILSETDVNIANSKFEDLLGEAIDKAAPMKTVQTRTKFNSWISAETKVKMKERDTARDKAKATDEDLDWTEYRSRRNDCTARQHKDKAKHTKNMFDTIEKEGDSADLFKTTRTILGFSRDGPPASLKDNGQFKFKQVDIANLQADFFEKKIKKIKNSLPGVCLDPLQTLRRIHDRWKPVSKPGFNLKSVTASEVSSMIDKLKNSSAFGRDKIDSSTLKIAAPVILPVLTHIINLSLCSSIFPAKWKIARVIPIKKGKKLDESNPASYRPICLLPVLSKLTERAVQSQLLDYLEKSEQISSCHHAYRKKYSTTTALIHIMDAVATATDLNLITASMTMDLSAAFDCVSHETLRQKLDFYGLDESTKSWITSYLQYRSSYVVIGSAVSTIRSSPQGVPQGSVLGPLLYLLYVNEMPCVVENKDCKDPTHKQTNSLFPPECKKCGTFIMYADDGQYLVSTNSRNQNQELIESTFWRLRDFLNANDLQVNESKTGLTEFMTHQKRSKIRGIPPDLTVKEEITDRAGISRLDDRLISDKPICKLLGLSLQNNLTWDAHLSTGPKAVLPAVRRQLGMLHKLRDKISQKAMLLLVNSLALSKMAYAMTLWGHSTENHTRKAQVVQNAAARLVTGKSKLTRQKELLSDCNWLDILDWTEYHSQIQLWKLLRWKLPAYLVDKISPNEDETLTTSSPRLRLVANTFRWKSVQSWNLLPVHLRETTGLKQFKTGLKNWLKTRKEDNLLDDLPLDRPPDLLEV